MATRQEIVDFLDRFKVATELGCFHVKNREKNTQALLDLGISYNERKEIILGLTPENYIAGPKPDDTDSQEVIWEFGADVEGTEVYIKLRVTKDRRKQHVYRALVWSFHPAECPIRYPLRGGGK
ncbi:MAG TPA: hypothetical protein ENH84_07580 [Phycisphaerae bacterium]|uniref:DUF4258 domain-containing protein n=1 Tax=marine sediment metagenome TaxID=412755 RepID=A0A0F8Y4B9_9ZZZZ|nr:hypothetical protein [Phycisphaerae bacterium]